MRKSICCLILLTVLLGWLSACSDVLYREIFPNERGANAGLELSGWKACTGAAAQFDPSIKTSGVTGAPRDLEPVSSFPASNDLMHGFMFNPQRAAAPQLLFTEEVDLNVEQITQISWYQSSDAPDAVQLAIRLDGVWYVSDEGFVQDRGWAQQAVALPDATWHSLQFSPGKNLEEGRSVKLSGSRVDGIGFYIPKLTGKMRLDTVEIRSGDSVEREIDSTGLLNGFVFPPVNFNPGTEYGPNARNYQGIAGIERAPGGRLWAAWYAGPVWEDRFNYVLVATSGDDGENWTDVSFVIDPDGTGPKRVADPCLWLDPDGKLWLFFWLNHDGLTVTMAMTTDNPDDENPVWTEPRPLFSGVMMNKPIITSKGEWLMPSAMWHRDGSCRVMVSADHGKTFSLRGTANIPPDRRNCDEEMIVERKDGSLWMLVRTADYGIGESVSMDDGKTWAEVSDYQQHATTRFTLLKLQSGNLLLIRNGPLGVRAGRDHMMAYLSEDDGATWKGELLLDERITSYPDATQAPDGTIYAIYDQNRGRDKGIVMAAFTEEDILDGKFNSPNARAKVLVNQASGDNPYLGRIGEGQQPREDASAAVPVTGKPRAGLKPRAGEIHRIPVAADYIFSNADYVSRVGSGLARIVPSVREFIFSPIENTEVTCTSPGMVYVLTPTPDRNPASVETELLAQGFEKTSATELDVIFKTDEKARFENLCSLYQKELKAGEKVKFGEWGVLVF